jgi:LmbE family N-acetylglucosaminyl deacetylase
VKSIFTIIHIALLFALMPEMQAQEKQLLKDHIFIIVAHSDDADGAGRVACKKTRIGKDVFLVSLTNADAGHQYLHLKKIPRFCL